MGDARGLSAGHRLAPHTADFVIEAWGGDRLACLSEALSALVEAFAEVEAASPSAVLPLSAGGSDEEVLVSLLEETIYNLDVRSVVPVRFHLRSSSGGRISGEMEVVPLEQALVIGPAPKGVSYHELSFAPDEGGWRCRALIDV